MRNILSVLFASVYDLLVTRMASVVLDTVRALFHHPRLFFCVCRLLHGVSRVDFSNV